MKIGYVRVSTAVQVEGYSLGQQKDKLLEAGCEKIYEDVQSGSSHMRPGLEDLRNNLRSGDSVIVCKLDRLGRSLTDLNGLIGFFKELDVEFVSLNENIDTGSVSGRLMFNILGSIAEFERELIMERTQAGIAEARKRGVKFGRPKKCDEAMVVRAATFYKNHYMTSGEAAKALGVARSTYYRLIDEAKDMGLFDKVADDIGLREYL